MAIRSICEAPKGTLWFGTRSIGLYRLRGGTVSFFGPESGLARKTVTDLKPASDGGVWVAAGTLQKIVDLDHFAIRTIAGVTTDNIRTLFEDSEGSLWLRTDDSGLIRAQKLPFPFISGQDGLPGNGAKTVTVDPFREIFGWPSRTAASPGSPLTASSPFFGPTYLSRT